MSTSNTLPENVKSEQDTIHNAENKSDNLSEVSVLPVPNEVDENGKKITTNSPQSPDISLSMQTTLRYSDVEVESTKEHDSSEEDSSDSVDKFEDASAMHEQSQFKNSFYEKLSVTCQNLESTVASLQKPVKNEDIDGDEENLSQTIPEIPQCNSVNRPETLSLSHHGIVGQKHKKDYEKSAHISKDQILCIDVENELTSGKDSNIPRDEQEDQGAYYIEPSGLSPNLLQGTIMRKGEKIEFVADNLEEKIKMSSSPQAHTDSTGSQGSRRSSVRSIASASSSTSFATSSGISHSPSSLLQQSPDDIPPIDAGAVLELENHAQRVADSLDLMMGNIRNNLHKMSAITIGCQDAYKRSVDITCDSVDGSIKIMYALMAKCEELSISMKPVDQLAAQIKEIKRILDLFELQLTEK